MFEFDGASGEVKTRIRGGVFIFWRNVLEWESDHGMRWEIRHLEASVRITRLATKFGGRGWRWRWHCVDWDKRCCWWSEIVLNYCQPTSEATASSNPGRRATPIPIVRIHCSLSDSPVSSRSNSVQHSPEEKGWLKILKVYGTWWQVQTSVNCDAWLASPSRLHLDFIQFQYTSESCKVTMTEPSVSCNSCRYFQQSWCFWRTLTLART